MALCLATCPAPGHGCRVGYACQPDGDGTSTCQLPCQVVSMGGQTFDTCQFGPTPNLACETDSGVCGGPVAYDAGLSSGDAGVDAGAADAGAVDAGLPDAGHADAGVDGGLTGADAGAPAADGGTGGGKSGCGCAGGVGAPDALWGLLGLGLLRRRRGAR